jgi:hypothetical protein
MKNSVLAAVGGYIFLDPLNCLPTGLLQKDHYYLGSNITTIASMRICLPVTATA